MKKHTFILGLSTFIVLASGQNEDNTTTTTTVLPDVTSSTPLPRPKVSATGVVKKMSAKQRLRQHLLDGYDKLVHPVEDHKDAVKVALGLALIHVDLNERQSFMLVDAWMRMSWVDTNLRWDPSLFDNANTMHFGAEDLWKPDVLLYNNADEANIGHYGKTHFLVENDGQVLWVPPGHFKAYCRMSLRFWPFDHQICKLKFGSWTSHGNEISLQIYKNSTKVEQLNFYTDNREWKIVDQITAETKTMYYTCCDEGYPDVTFTFNLQRESQQYRAVIVLPCLVIMLMTGCSFLLTPTSGEKLTINGLALIASLMYLIYFATTLPFSREDMPIIVTFYSNITALIGIAIMLNVICMSMARERKYTSPPKFLKNMFSGCLGKLLCLGNYFHQVSSTHQRLVLELTDMAESEQQSDGRANSPDSNGGEAGLPAASMSCKDDSIVMKDWLLVAAGLERLFFTIYAIAFAIITSVYV